MARKLGRDSYGDLELPAGSLTGSRRRRAHHLFFFGTRVSIRPYKSFPNIHLTRGAQSITFLGDHLISKREFGPTPSGISILDFPFFPNTPVPGGRSVLRSCWSDGRLSLIRRAWASDTALPSSEEGICSPTTRDGQISRGEGMCEDKMGAATNLHAHLDLRLSV